MPLLILLIRDARKVMHPDLRYHPEALDADNLPTTLAIAYLGLANGDNRQHVETTDFGLQDPWSLAMREAIARLKTRVWFNGQDIMELGIGDGRNIRFAAHGGGVIAITGVDVEPHRLNAAHHNLSLEVGMDTIPKTFYLGDAVTVLDQLKSRGESISGRVLMCLPQSNGASDSAADSSQSYDAHAPFQAWDTFGLKLNAGALMRLAEVATLDTEVLIILSGRIDPGIHSDLFNQTGWKNEEVVVQRRVRQDYDTDLEWMRERDEANRFFDSQGYAISIQEALRRMSNYDPKSGEDLDVFHDVYVYRLRLLQK